MKKYVKATSTLENPIPEMNGYDMDDAKEHAMFTLFDWLGMEEIATEDAGFGYIGGWYKNDLILYLREDGVVCLYKNAKSQKSNWEQVVTSDSWDLLQEEHPDWKVFWDWDKSVDITDIAGFLSWFE